MSTGELNFTIFTHLSNKKVICNYIIHVRFVVVVAIVVLRGQWEVLSGYP